MSLNSNIGGWIHIFTITDTQTHKDGYTIYKITSIVFPRSLPQALTCLKVWKRFHDVKRLYRELNRRYKSLKLPGHLPAPKDSFFKRFDPNVIQRRKEYILELLDFAAQHPALYKCHEFGQFFSDSSQLLSSTFHSTLPEQNAFKVTPSANTTEKNRSLCNLQDNKLAKSQSSDKLLTFQCDFVKNDTESLLIGEFSRNEECNDLNAASDECRSFQYQSIPVEMDNDYIYEAALIFSEAVNLEVNLDYNEAHEKYKSGIEILFNGSKDDSNEDRKLMAHAKAAKYLRRAEEIYNRFLSAETKSVDSFFSNFQLSIGLSEDSGNESAMQQLERPCHQLGNYKVLQIIGGSVMRVQCVIDTQQQIYILKGIEKPSCYSPSHTIFLPQDVPYMVELVSYFQTQHKIFLLLKQAEGGQLYDYIQSYKSVSNEVVNVCDLFPEIQDQKITSVFDNENITESQHTNYNTQKLATSSSSMVDEHKEKSPHKSLILIKSPHKFRTAKMPEACLKKWISELAVAINSLHEKGIVLGDLHMENVLLGSKGQLLLSYFYQNENLSPEDHEHKSLNPVALFGHFVAPERPLNFKSDWWSYGIVLYQLLVNMPFKTAHPGRIDLYGCVQFPDNIDLSNDARDLIDNLLRQSPVDRLNYEGIKQHSFFNRINWLDIQQNSFNYEH